MHGHWCVDRVLGSLGDAETPGDEIAEGTLAWIEGDGENVGRQSAPIRTPGKRVDFQLPQ